MKRASKSGIPCFKRWSRKKYGVFASLGREVKIGVLSLTMSIITFNAKGEITSPDSLSIVRNVDIEELIVTAEKLNPTRGVVTPTEVYSRDTMLSAPLQTIESALKLNPSVDLRERGGKGMQADISLRGGTPDQTMVLLNGIDFTDARTGHQSHSLPVDLEIISSIDLIGGLSGIGAYSGAVNMVTSPLKPAYIRAEVAVGAYGYLYSNISGAAYKKGLSILAAASLRRSDGYITNTDFDNTNIFTRITYDNSCAGLFDIQAGYQRRDFGSNGFYSLTYPDQFEHTETGLASLRWSRSWGVFTLTANASYRKNNDRYELFRDGNGAPEGWVPNYHTTDNVGAEIGGEYRWKAGKTSIGIDYKYHHIYSNALGELMQQPIGVPGTDAQYTREKDRNIINSWLSHKVVLGSTQIAGSVNIARSSYETFPSWSLSLVQRIAESWSAHASSTRSMRLPTFTDLYYTNATHIGNPGLKAEHALTNIIGIDYKKSAYSGGLSAFYRYGTDIIDWAQVETPEGNKWKSTQLTKLNTFGVELYGTYRSNGFLRYITVSYGWLTSDKSKADYISKYALDYMKHKAALQFGIRIWDGLMADITAGWYMRNSTPATNYEPYLLLDARLSWRNEIFTVYAEATNLLDSKYYDFVGLQQPPRWITVGIVLTI